MNQSPIGQDLLRALKREWWVVAIAVVAAVIGALFVSRSFEPSFSAVSVVKLDNVTLGDEAPRMVGDRLLEALTSDDFYDFAAEQTGTEAEEIERRLKVSAANKEQDRFEVRITGSDDEGVEADAAELRDAVIAYAQARGTETEIKRLDQVIGIAENALEVTEEQRTRLAQGDPDPFHVVEVEARIADFQETIVNASVTRDALLLAYAPEGDVRVVAQSTAAKRQRLLVGAVIAGLFAGLVVAAAREFWLRREAAN